MSETEDPRWPLGTKLRFRQDGPAAECRTEYVVLGQGWASMTAVAPGERRQRVYPAMQRRCVRAVYQLPDAGKQSDEVVYIPFEDVETYLEVVSDV